MTPGNYLRLRRRAAGLAIDELAIETEAVREIEAGLRAPNDMELQALLWSFRFDLVVLGGLARGIIERICRSCGCSQHDACIGGECADEVCGTIEAEPCCWVDSDLCSACAHDARPWPEGLPA